MDKNKKDDISKLLKDLPRFDLKTEAERAALESKSQSFEGMPMSGTSTDKLVLIVDPTGASPKTIEFNIADIERVDELPECENPVTHNKSRRVRIWVRNGAPCLIYVHGTVVARPKIPIELGIAREPFIEKVFGGHDLAAHVELLGCPCPSCSCPCAGRCSSCTSCPCSDQFSRIGETVIAVANTKAANEKAADNVLTFNNNISVYDWWS